eukprot:6200028-Pleurochrysis_carterae.AAC.3
MRESACTCPHPCACACARVYVRERVGMRAPKHVQASSSFAADGVEPGSVQEERGDGRHISLICSVRFVARRAEKIPAGTEA